jgi:MtN3 and saliva related transmembrane protein
VPAVAVLTDTALVTLVGLAAGIMTTGCLIPQVIRTRRTRSAGDFSLVYLVAMDAGLALWIVYGFCLGSVPIIVANCVSLVLVTCLLACRLRRAGP